MKFQKYKVSKLQAVILLNIEYTRMNKLNITLENVMGLKSRK